MLGLVSIITHDQVVEVALEVGKIRMVIIAKYFLVNSQFIYKYVHISGHLTGHLKSLERNQKRHNRKD